MLGIYETAATTDVVSDLKLFDEFSDAHYLPPTLDIAATSYCPDCDTPMELSGIEYQCSTCGLTQPNNTAVICHEDTISNNLRITTGVNKGRFYNMTVDYTKTQRKMIADQLYQHSTRYKGPAFPINVLAATANQYNRIQKLITEDVMDCEGKVTGQKKYVRRGTIKDEVIAGLIYFEGIREKLYRMKKDVAIFMNLPINGFARGEDILRNLEAEGKIDIPVDDEPIEGFIDRYLEALGMDTQPNYSKFIVDMVQASEKNKIGMNSHLSSKIVSAIYIIISQCGLKITSAAIEKACDNTKKNTFMKFTKIVATSSDAFEPIFIKYGIPTNRFF